MVFSSKIFLFYFLPAVLAGYYLLKRSRTLSNLFLTMVSLGFYAWGEPRFVLVMMASIVVNWLFGLWVDRVRDNRAHAKGVIALMAAFNLGLLGVFKYLTFILTNVKSYVLITQGYSVICRLSAKAQNITAYGSKLSRWAVKCTLAAIWR